MDMKRKKELLEAYKNRHPEMGVISFKCIATGESFLGISTDTKADFNSNQAKLAMNYHPNRRLQALWNEYGHEGFECSVLKRLEYENKDDNQNEKLEALRERCLSEDPKAGRIWR